MSELDKMLLEDEKTILTDEEARMKLAFTESVLQTRWDLSFRIDKKLELYITISGLFALILGYLLTSTRVVFNEFSLAMASLSLLLVMIALLDSIVGLAPHFRSPVRKEQEYLTTSLRTTAGIRKISFDTYLHKVLGASPRELIKQNVNQIILVNEILVSQARQLKRIGLFIVVSGILSAVAIISSVL